MQTFLKILLIICYLRPSVQTFLPRIVNGRRTDIADVPYQVQILKQMRTFCGGSILDRKHVISAAHCFVDPQESIDADEYRIRAGTSQKKIHDGKLFKVADIHIHPQFDVEANDFDVAILVIKDGFEFDENIQPIALHDEDNFDDLIGQEGLVSGWGRTSYDGKPADFLQSVHLPILPQSECDEKYHQYPITDRMFCAGFPDGERDACLGDSGGPYVLKKKLLGIVSWGIGCAEKEHPGIFTYIPSVMDFIENIVDKN